MVSLGLAFLAGVLTILSPCVLPLLPLILASAAAEHRFAPAALAAGVGLSFAIVGGLLAGAGFAAALHGSLFRSLAALALIVIGLVLVLPRLQTSITVALGPIANWANAKLGSRSTSGLYGQLIARQSG